MQPSRGSRIGIHRQDRVDEEALCFVPTSDGTQTLGCLMTRQVDIRCVCCQQHAGALHGLLAGGHPMGEHDLLVSHCLIVQKTIDGQGITPVAHAFRQ